MPSRLAAARQLGVAGLARRSIWRLGMVLRIGRFYLLRRSSVWQFGLHAVWPGPDTKLFLAPVGDIRSIIESGGFPETARSRILEDANAVLENRVELRGNGTVSLSYAAGDWYARNAGDPAFVNRHDFALTLAHAWFLTAEERYRDRLREMFGYWIQNFSVSKLIRCDTPIDAAIRLLNWLSVFHLVALELRDEQRTRLGEIVYLQLEYISAWRSAGGNHLVLEALAHYVVGSAIGESRAAIRWRTWSRRTLIREVLRQTSSDGVHTEQSTFYHHAVSTHFLKFVLTARASGDELPQPVTERVGEMLDFAHDVMKPDLTHPVAGDGEPMTTRDREHLEAKLLPAARAVLFGRPVFEGFLPSLNDSAVWFLGVDPSAVDSTPEAPGSRCFEAAGLAVAREEQRYLFFDAAPFSDWEFPHHGHSDALNVELAYGMTGLFVDPGGYGYYDDDFRRFFRSTRAHNTISLDGREQSEIAGVLGYGRLAKSVLEFCDRTPDLDHFRGSHDGYRPACHRREVFFRKGAAPYLLIVDYLAAEGDHSATAYFHLSPDVTVDQVTSCLADSRTGRRFSVAFFSSTTLSQRVVTGRREPPMQGWISPATRVAVAADVWEIEFEFQTSAYLATFVSLSDGELAVSGHADSHLIEVRADRFDRYLLSPSRRETEYSLDNADGSLS